MKTKIVADFQICISVPLNLFKYSPQFIYFSWKYNRNYVDIKEMPPSKILQGRCVEPETSFSSRFFFNIPEISAQIWKPTKY